MTHQSRARMLLCAALISTYARGNDEVVVIKTPSLSYIVVGCVIAGVAAYKVREFFSSSSDSGRLQKVDTDLSTFKKETGENFDAVVATQETLTQGQKQLVTGQGKLQGQVTEVDAKISAARKEIEETHAVTLKIQAETTDIKQRTIAMQEELKAIQDKLTRLAVQSARIEAEMAKAQNMRALELSVGTMSGKVEHLAKIVVTKEDLREVVREEVCAAIELARNTPSSLRLPASSSKSADYLALTTAQTSGKTNSLKGVYESQ